ncbi:hypothetical protein P7C73_g228, partial [Tremellales sp. Uapishka_1]
MSFLSGLSGKSASSSSSSINKVNETSAPPTSEIFTVPAQGTVPKQKAQLDQGQLQKVEDLKAYTATLLLPESDPYHPWEKRFLSDPGCHPRYMRAAKWKLEDGKKRIKGTMEWRREYKPELIQPGDVGVEAETGKIILTGFDLDARPILYMRPGRENTERSPRQIRHLIYHLERAIDLMPPGQEQVAIIVDYASATSQSNPSIGVARQVLNILQNHYVERMGRAIVVRMPYVTPSTGSNLTDNRGSWWVNAFFSGISPFLDPITRDKMRFNPKLLDLVPASQLDKDFGGDYNFHFDHTVYWNTLTEFCHIAPDGGRLDNDGKACVPPLGNGAKAAAEGMGKASAAGDEEKATAAQESETARDEKKATAAQEPETAATATPLENGMAELHVSGLKTVPGPPEGDVVFDHKPSEKEIKIARESMDIQR